MSININIEDNSNIAKVNYTYGSRNYTKMLSIDEVSNLFITNKIPRTPFLPIGTRQYAVFGRTHKIWIEIPPHKRTFKYGSRERNTTYSGPIPPLMVLIRLEEEDDHHFRLSAMKCFAVENMSHVTTKKIYNAPLLNLYDDGRVCFGSVPIFSRKIDDISKAGIYIDGFLTSIGNDDLRPVMTGVATTYDLVELYKRLEREQAEVFPTNYLKEYRSNAVRMFDYL